MKRIGVSTPPGIKTIEDLFDVMAEVRKHGFDFLEINCTDAPPMNPKMLSHVEKKAIREKAASLCLSLAIHGSNDINLISLNPVLRKFALSYIEASVKFARKLNAELLNTHPGTVLQYYSKDRFIYFSELFDYDSVFQDSLKKMGKLGEEYSVLICLENTSRETGKLLIEGVLLEQSDFIGFTYDAGHAYLSGEMLELKNKMGGRIKNVHIHDTDGKIDTHRGIGKGVINWGKVFPIRSKRFTLEIRPLSEAFESKPVLELFLKQGKRKHEVNLRKSA